MQQFDVPGAVADPVVVAMQAEVTVRIIMLAECAAQRHQTITDQAFRERAALRRECRGDAEAGDIVGQGQWLAMIVAMVARITTGSSAHSGYIRKNGFSKVSGLARTSTP